MAILPMRKVIICGKSSDTNAVMESLQRMEDVQIEGLLEDEEIDTFDENSIFDKSERIKKNAQTAEDAAEIIKSYCIGVSEPFMLEGRKLLDKNVYDEYEDSKYLETLKLAKKINAYEKKMKEKKSDISQLYLKLEALYPWKKLDIPIDTTGTKSTSIYVGTFPEQLGRGEIDTQVMENIANIQQDIPVSDIPYELEVVSSIKELTYVVIVCLKKHEDIVFEAIRRMGFAYPSVQSESAITQEIKDTKTLIKKYNNQIKKLKKLIKSNKRHINDLRFLQDYETLRYDKYQALGEVYKTDKIFMITGYIPRKKYKNFEKKLLANHDVYVDSVKAERDGITPVKLQNVGFAEPLENTIHSYSPPGKDDGDPTFTVSLFYYFLFGMMFSDAGYGLLMVIACGLGLLLYGKNAEKNWKNNLTMFFLCGAFTVFWGILFGSFFGDLIGVISSTFSSGSVSFKPVWFDPVAEPMRLLMYSMIIGIVHLLTGLGYKGYLAIKQGDKETFLYDVVTWYALLTSLFIILVDSSMLEGIFGYQLNVPGFILELCKYVAIISSVVIVAMSARDIDNIAGRIGSGIYNLYGVSSWLSDVLSYARLLALGLATGVIGTVINKMAGMVAESVNLPVVDLVLFFAIVIAGHALNFGINVLGAYVHTNRLQYVEYFGKFYEGGGRLFTPLSMNTKYFKFKEN